MCPTPVCIRTHTKDHVRMLNNPVVHARVLVDYGNTKITSMHLYPQRRNVAVQVAEELKTVTYAAPSYGGTQKKNRKKTAAWPVVHVIRAGLHDNVPADFLPRWQKVCQSRASLSPDALTSQIG